MNAQNILIHSHYKDLVDRIKEVRKTKKGMRKGDNHMVKQKGYKEEMETTQKIDRTHISKNLTKTEKT